jgi:hypothetical protein
MEVMEDGVARPRQVRDPTADGAARPCLARRFGGAHRASGALSHRRASRIHTPRFASSTSFDVRILGCTIICQRSLTGGESARPNRR